MRSPLPIQLNLCCALLCFLAVSCNSGSSQKTENFTERPDKHITKSWYPVADTSFLFQAYLNCAELLHYNELAVKKAHTPAVKSFAEKSASWHRKTQEEISQMIRAQKAIISQTSSKKLQTKLATLRALSASDFEEAYLKALLDSQPEIISLCKHAARHATDTAVSAWAVRMVPKLESHALAAKELATLIKRNKE